MAERGESRGTGEAGRRLGALWMHYRIAIVIQRAQAFRRCPMAVDA